MLKRALTPSCNGPSIEAPWRIMMHQEIKRGCRKLLIERTIISLTWTNHMYGDPQTNKKPQIYIIVKYLYHRKIVMITFIIIFSIRQGNIDVERERQSRRKRVLRNRNYKQDIQWKMQKINTAMSWAPSHTRDPTSLLQYLPFSFQIYNKSNCLIIEFIFF